VLYGEITYIPLDTVTLGFIEIPKATLLLQILATIILAVVILFYPVFKLITFDEHFAKTIGVKTRGWQLLLMLMVSLSTVASFEAVGAILVVSFLVIPPASAYLIHTQLKPMLFTAIALGALASVSGYYISYVFDLSTAACMAAAAGTQFVAIYIYTLIKKQSK
jgi:manganese/zinc/iron transport system permease protein